MQLKRVWPGAPKPICTQMLRVVGLVSLALTKAMHCRQAMHARLCCGAAFPVWVHPLGCTLNFVGVVSPQCAYLLCAADTAALGGCVYRVCAHGVCLECGIHKSESTSGLVVSVCVCVCV